MKHTHPFLVLSIATLLAASAAACGSNQPLPFPLHPVDAGPGPLAKDKVAYCSDLRVTTETAAVLGRGGGEIDELRKGDVVIRQGRTAMFGNLEVAYRTREGAVATAEIAAASVEDRCPADAFEGFYAVAATRLAPRVDSRPDEGCAVPQGTLLEHSAFAYDSAVSFDQVKLTLSRRLAGCSLGEGFVPTADVAYAVGYLDVVAGVPVLTPTRAPDPVKPDAGPTPEPAPTDGEPDEPTQARCGVRGSSITLDGREAFFFPDEAERQRALIALTAQGVCKAGNRCGVTSHSITLGGDPAFFFPSDASRLQRLLGLQASGACGKPRLGVSGSSLTIDGHPAFFFPEDDERVNAAKRLASGGAVDDGGRCGVSGSSITLDGEVAFFEPSDTARLDRILALARGGVCQL